MTTRSSTKRLQRAPFGALADGRAVERFTLRNAHGVEVALLTYGGIVVSVRVPDRAGRLDDVVLGHDTLEGYVEQSPYFGAIVGRCANRIARGDLPLDGEHYALARNDGPNQLHGGVRGFDKAVWTARPFTEATRAGVALTHTSPDGDEGYPGTLHATVTYALGDDDALTIDYAARADAPTVVNLTHHSYFNLAGALADDILAHELAVDADAFTPIDETLVPTGEIAPVAATPFDFRTPVAIGERIGADDVQLRRAGGYDHNFVVRRAPGAPTALVHVATVREPITGRVLDVASTEPGVQLYSGNFLDGSIRGKGGRVYGHRSGFCLETQHFPDSPHHPAFPSIVLRPGAEYTSRTIYTFSAGG